MKILILCLFIFQCSVSFSQDLINTKWKYLQPGFDTLYINFEADTLRVWDKGETIEWVVSWYKESGDTLWTTDNYGEAQVICNLTDTGIYTFDISNDTLFFTLIKDDCSFRASDFIIPWNKRKPTPTGLKLNSASTAFSLYPNPNHGAFKLEVSEKGIIEIMDIQGKLIYQTQVNVGRNQIYSDLDKGFYQLIFKGESEMKIKKFMVD